MRCQLSYHLQANQTAGNQGASAAASLHAELAPCLGQGAKLEEEWNSTLAEYEKKYPEEGAEFKQLTSGELPDGWDAVLPTFSSEDKVMKRIVHKPIDHHDLHFMRTHPLASR